MTLMNGTLFPFVDSFLYCLFGSYTRRQCYLERAHLTFDESATDFKEAPTARKYQELLVCIRVLGVYEISDRWGRVEDEA